MEPSVIINRITEFKQSNHDPELEYSVQSLGNGACVCILRGGFNNPNPREYMESVVLDICQNDIRHLFVESNLDIPNIKVIIFDFDNIPFLE